MKVISMLIAITFYSISSALAQTKNYFPNLTKQLIDTIYNASYYYDNSSRLMLVYTSKLSKKDPFYFAEEYTDDPILVARYKNPKLKDSITIAFDGGMSDDPGFSIWTKNHKLMGAFSGLEMYLNSNGTIFSSGHTNSFFNCRRRFQIVGDTVTEVRQSFYYVGLKGNTLKDIILYRDKTGPAVVSKILKGNDIEILLCEAPSEEYGMEKLFLVRTDFGIVGWLRLTEDDVYDPIIPGFFYAGD